jgi:hypothetical protein
VHFTPPDPYVRFNRCHTARATGRGGPVRPNPEWFPAANSTPAGSPAPGAGRSGEVASRFRHGGRCRFNDKVGFDSTKHGIKPVGRHPAKGQGRTRFGPLPLEVLQAFARIWRVAPVHACISLKTRLIKSTRGALFYLLLDAIHAMNGRAKEPQ